MSGKTVQPIGLVVEGDAEFRALPLLHTEKLIPGCPPLKVLNCKGIGGEVQPSGVAFRVHKLVLQHIAAGRPKVVVCVDREGRSLCAPGFAKAIWAELDKLLRKRQFSASTTTVVVADRAFEAFLLADAAGLHARGALKRAPNFHSFEGQSGSGQAYGKRELAVMLGGDYAETKDGPHLFRRLDFSVARRHGPGQSGSRSLDKLLRSIGV